MNNSFMPPYGANFNGYNGYNNGYNNYRQQSNSFAYVNGIEGAKAYIVPPNSTTVLMDSEKPFLYIKTADMYGRAELKTYEYTEHKEPTASTQTEYVTRKEFEELKAVINEFSANYANVKHDTEPTANGNADNAE